MSRKTRIRYVVLLISVGVALMLFNASRSPFSETWTIEAKESYWHERIASVGPEKAYKEFVGAMSDIESHRWHFNAHIFGTALYKTAGTPALGICGLDFSFGCLHEVFKWIIAENGTQGLTDAYHYCNPETDHQRAHQCSHAIGHGLFSYFGYTEESLLRTLAVCEKDFYDDPINGCVGGAFMEYFLYTTLGPEVQTRSPVNDDWYAPCSQLSLQFKQACYTWLVQWWYHYDLEQKVPADQTFPTLGERCRGVPALYILDCFERLGQKVAHAAPLDPDRMKVLCALAAETDDQELSCLSYAAWYTTYMNKENLQSALLVCEGLSERRRQECESYARNESSKGVPFPEE